PCGGLNAAAGTTKLTGSVTGIGTPSAGVAVGSAVTEFQPPQGLNFSIPGVAAGQRDLIAAATNVNTNGTRSVPRMIYRPNVAYTSTIPTLNFNGPEFFNPQGFPVTTTNVNSDQLSLQVSLVTANGSAGAYFGAPAGPNGGLSYPGIPDSLIQPSDLHAVTIFASASAVAFRLAETLQHSAAPETVDLGPALSQPTVTSLGTSPSLRLRAQLPSQSAYNALARAEFDQNSNVVAVSVSAGYAGSAPPTWSLDMPDLSTAGYDPAWGLKSGSPVQWTVFAGGGSVLPLIGATPSDGQRAIVGAMSSSSSSFSIARRRKGLLVRR